MTTTIGETDIDLTLLFDFEFELKCEAMNKDCPNTAEWKWTLKCCGATVLLCEDCHQKSLECRAAYSLSICGFCNTEGDASQLFKWERI